MNVTSTKQTTTSSSKKTLDIQHTNKLYEFQAKAEEASILKTKYNGLTEKIMDYEAKKKSGQSISKDDQDTLIQLVDERDQLRKYIYDIECNDDEVDYLINTAPILFKYYDIIEKGNDDDIPNTKMSENSILKWFVKTNKVEQPNGNKEDRASLLEKYLSYTDENFTKPVENESCSKCQSCGSTNMNIQINDGIIYCNECSCVEYIIVDHERPSYKDPPREISYFAYKRINHFNEYRVLFDIFAYISIKYVKNVLYTFLP
jgi:hypothetical protein